MHPHFELRELGLAEHRPLGVLEIRPQQRQPGVVVLDCLQHVAAQQRLVERGCHLRNEDRVISGRVRLRLVRKVALHRVPELVGQRAHVLVLAVVVEQHVGMNVVGAAVGVGAGPLAGRREQIDPPFGERALDGCLVIPAKRRHGVEHVLLGLLRRVGQRFTEPTSGAYKS